MNAERSYERGFRDGYAEGRRSVRAAHDPERTQRVQAMVALRTRGMTWRDVGDVFGITGSGARNAAFGAWIAGLLDLPDSDVIVE